MRAGSAHLGDQVSAYVDRALAAEALHRLDRHIVICQACRSRVDDERLLVGYLRRTDTIGIPTSLTAALRGLSADMGDILRPAPLEVSPRSLPVTRSPMRAALLAGLAASASAAAAWGIASPAVAPAVVAPAVPARVPSSVAPGFATRPPRNDASTPASAPGVVGAVTSAQPTFAVPLAWLPQTGVFVQVAGVDRAARPPSTSVPARTFALVVARGLVRRRPATDAPRSLHARQSPHD